MDQRSQQIRLGDLCDYIAGPHAGAADEKEGVLLGRRSETMGQVKETTKTGRRLRIPLRAVHGRGGDSRGVDFLLQTRLPLKGSRRRVSTTSVTSRRCRRL
jgi:hypothetical protein